MGFKDEYSLLTWVAFKMTGNPEVASLMINAERGKEEENVLGR